MRKKYSKATSLVGLTILFGMTSIFVYRVAIPSSASVGGTRGLNSPGPKAATQGLLSQEAIYNGGLSDSIEATFYDLVKEENRTGTRYHANNLSQGYRAGFTMSKMTVSSDRPTSYPWEVSFEFKGYGYGNRFTLAGSGKLAASGNSAIYKYHLSPEAARLTQWYVNRPKGLEHGFTIDSPPNYKNVEDKLRLKIGITGDLYPNLDQSKQKVLLNTRDGNQILNYDSLVVYDASNRVLPSNFELNGRLLDIVIDDSSATYPLTVDPLLTFVKKITASDGQGNSGPPNFIDGDAFGTSVAISGDSAIAGSPFDDAKGSAYIFDRNLGGTNNWGERKKLTSADGAEFGGQVSINGDTVVVGARSTSATQGAAYIFERNQGGANNWGLVKKIVGSDAISGSQFGSGVGVFGDTIVIGAKSANPNTGKAYIFDRNLGGAGNWGERKVLTASDAGAGFSFGSSVAIDGSTVIIGSAFVTSGAGAAYIFMRDQGGANNWGEVKKIVGSDTTTGDSFGAAVALSGDTAVVGAFGKASQLGKGYIFGRNQGGANNWGEVKGILSSDGQPGDRFGFSVAVSGDTAILGASNDNSAQGAGYVFDRNQGGANNWGEVHKLLAGDGVASDGFGFGVAISSFRSVVGAPGDDLAKGGTYIFDGTPAAPVCTSRMISHSSSQAIVGFGNESGCATGSGVKSSSHWRAFDLASAPFSFTQPFNIQSVDFGIESSFMGPVVTINLYTSNAAFPTGFPGSLTLIGTSGPVAITPDVSIASPIIKNIPVTGIAPASSRLIVEVAHPDLTLPQSLFLGFNGSAETGPTYRSSPTCGQTTPTTISSIVPQPGNIPGATRLVMNVRGCEGTLPTAAGVEVSGRVLTPSGRGLRNALVAITDQEGGRKVVRTGRFGSYKFEDIEVGKTYVISVQSRMYTFEPRVINVLDNLADIDFIAAVTRSPGMRLNKKGEY